MASSDKSQPVHSPSKMSLESVGNMDMTKAGRGIWLVKVPKYLGDKWKECADSEVGTAYLTKVPGKLAKVTFVPNEHTLGNCKSALEYVFAQRDNENLTLGVFSEYISDAEKLSKAEADAEKLSKAEADAEKLSKAEADADANAEDEAHVDANAEDEADANADANAEDEADAEADADAEDKKLYFEGHITYKFDCQTPGVLSASPDYIQLKKDLTVKDGQDRLKTKTIDSPANTSMSRAHKRNRYLQKILKKIGIYNIEGPFKRMWQLKPEYCCY
ncbi:general transcription factor IIF subunit 2 isoform X2 [Procambarus clarkii]|uniref:general transcription factor IIF subunit 2 isoform X2 n=1 Tax=Procambarus clarkii TaxID=6728 RepID=UPI0037431FB9